MQEKKRKQAETERKRAEVRARLEEASKAKKAKKGFMTPDRKKKLRVSPLFVSSLLNLVARPSKFSQDILFKSSIAISRRESFVIFPFSANGNGINAAPGFSKVCFILHEYPCRIECSLSTTKSNSPFPIYLIASSHAIIFSRVVRAAGQYRDNPLCTLCAPIFSRNISRNGYIHFSITFSHSPPLRLSMFCFPAGGAERPKLSLSLSRLFTFTLWSRLTFAILFPSSCNILQNIHAPPLFDPRFSSCTVANIRSRST